MHILALENAREAIAEGADGLVHLFVDGRRTMTSSGSRPRNKGVRDPDIDRPGERHGVGGGASLVDGPSAGALAVPERMRVP